MRSLAFAFVSATVLMIRVGSVDAQSVRITSEVSCATCSIVVEDVVTLKDVLHDGPAGTITRDQVGQYYVMDQRDQLLRMFGADGRFMRQIGGRGAGPGEYQIVRNVIVSGDGRINVIDGALSRRSQFAQSGTFLGSTTIPVLAGVGMDAVVLPDDQLVANSVLRGQSDAGFSLQRVNVKGERTALIDEFDFDARARWLVQRILWVRKNGDLLVARPYEFTIDVYDAKLQKQAAITRAAEWIRPFERSEQPGDGMFDKPYRARLRAVWEDPDGLIWLCTMVPSSAWRPVAPPRQGTELSADALAALSDRPRVETIIEALDLKQGRVVARARMDGPAGLPFGGGYFSMAEQDSVGEPSVRISRVRLQR